MTDAPTAERPLLTRFLELEYADRSYAQGGKTVPVSHNDAHLWTTVPWDTEVEDPDGMHAGASGWTVLTAPTGRDLFYSGVAALRLQGGVAGCSTHLMPYHARALAPGEVDGVDNVVTKREACEVFVGPEESHPSAAGVTYSNTHLVLPFQGRLPAGQKLRMFADYWNAPAGSVALRMCGATVTCFWGYATEGA